jgi:hypothetical protein
MCEYFVFFPEVNGADFSSTCLRKSWWFSVEHADIYVPALVELHSFVEFSQLHLILSTTGC